jgi:surface carbohydrate biosynthesis protein
VYLTKTLYIPIEIIDRELGGAILLAATAVSRGWSVVLGGKQAVFNNISRFSASPGIFFLKSVVPGEVFKQDEIKARGHRVVSLDVEGLVPSNGEAGVRLRYSAESIEKSDLLFFWGEEHFASVQKVYTQIDGRSYVTGSPIIDEIKVRGARKSTLQNLMQKKKILIGTSCGFVNHINGIEFAREMRRNAYSDNVSQAEILALELEAHLDIEIFEYWKKIVPLIAEHFSDCDVVLRPHPSENADFWRSYLKAFQNVRIDSGQPILEELQGANAYIHFNSTSAITSTVLGVPTFMPVPPLENSLRERVTYVVDISTLAETSEELIRLISDALARQSHKDIPKELYRYCENLKPGAMQASDAIIDRIEKKYLFSSAGLILGRRGYMERLLVCFRRSKYFLLWLLAIFFARIGYKARRPLPPLNAYKSARAKQPKTSHARLRLVMAGLIEPAVLSTLKTEQISENLFLVKSMVDAHACKT